jgi:hypothetical protein
MTTDAEIGVARLIAKIIGEETPVHLQILNSMRDGTYQPFVLPPEPSGKRCVRSGCDGIVGTHISYCDDCFAAYMREYRVSDFDIMYRIDVRRFVSDMIASGQIKRQPCEFCGEFGGAHHEDYRKPLELRWLCPHHHGLVTKGDLWLLDSVKAL